MFKMVMISLLMSMMMSNTGTVRTIANSDGVVIYQEVEHSDGTKDVIVDIYGDEAVETEDQIVK